MKIKSYITLFITGILLIQINLILSSCSEERISGSVTTENLISFVAVNDKQVPLVKAKARLKSTNDSFPKILETFDKFKESGLSNHLGELSISLDSIHQKIPSSGNFYFLEVYHGDSPDLKTIWVDSILIESDSGHLDLGILVLKPAGKIKGNYSRVDTSANIYVKLTGLPPFVEVQNNGKFEIDSVFPGSYKLDLWSDGIFTSSTVDEIKVDVLGRNTTCLELRTVNITTTGNTVDCN